MKKAELRNWIKNNFPGMWITELLAKIDQLEVDPPTPEPKTITFSWPYDDTLYKPVLAGKGTEVTQLHYFNLGPYSEVYGVVGQHVFSWSPIDGGVLDDSGINSLVLQELEPETVTIWLNYYGDGYEVHQTKATADHAPNDDRIGPAIKITFPKPINTKP